MSHALFAFALLVAQTNASNAQWPPLKVVDVRWIDTTVSACVDFSRFANGAWLAHDTIPAAYSSSGVTRDMSDRNELVVRSVLEDAAARAGAQVMALEPSLAQASMARVERRDPAKTDHPMSVEQLTALASRIGWPAYFRAIGLRAPVRKVNVAQPDFVHRVDSLLQATPLAAWRAYLTYHTVASAAPWLSTAFVNEDFAFRSRFSGAKALLPRWKRCLRETDGDLGEALGRAYVAKTFPPEARARARAVIDDIRAAFHERLLHLTWMTDSTRAQALDKVARMGEKVGYPDRWRDYARLRVAEGPFVLNAAHANAFEWQRTVNRPGPPVDA